MPAAQIVLGDMRLGFLVKRVKGKLYVYEYLGIEGGKRIVKYVGPLEAMVRTYQALNAGITVNHKLTRKELRKLAEYIVDNLTHKHRKQQREEWWTGRDLNPGPPGCKPGALPG